MNNRSCDLGIIKLYEFKIKKWWYEIMDQQKVIEKWLRQIRDGEINPSALGLGNDKEKAMEKLQNQLKKLSSSRSIPKR